MSRWWRICGGSRRIALWLQLRPSRATWLAEEANLDMKAVVETAVEEVKTGEEAAVEKAMPDAVAVKAVAELAVPDQSVVEQVVAEQEVADEESVSSGCHDKKKRRLEEHEDIHQYEVTYQVIDGGSPVSFDSLNLGKSVDECNIDSFISEELIKLYSEAPGNYVNGIVYICPYHPSKPKGGFLVNPMQHVRDLAAECKDDRKKTEHVAVLQVLHEADLT